MNKKISAMPPITGDELSINDELTILDNSENNAEIRNKRLALGELASYMSLITNTASLPQSAKVTPGNGNFTVIFNLVEFNVLTDHLLFRNGVLQSVPEDYSYTNTTNTFTVTLTTATVSNELFQLIAYTA